MNQDPFVSKYGPRWDAFEASLLALETKAEDADTTHFPERYRELCRDLAIARSRQYSYRIVQRLNRLAVRGHRYLYRRAPILRLSLLGELFTSFPRRVREEWRVVFLAGLLFYATALVVWSLVLKEPTLVHSFLPEGYPDQIGQMYDPRSPQFTEGRGEDSDVAMFGFYIMNNVGIALRTFGMGVLGGVGSAFTLVFNGVVLGGAAAYISILGDEGTFYPFVIGHGALELNAIVLSGAAGIKLGLAFLAPGRRSRGQALVEEGRSMLIIVYGAMAMLLGAAFLEAFWSSAVLVPAAVKIGVGAAGWMAVACFFVFAGRADGA